MIFRVVLAQGLERRLKKVPHHVVLKLLGWVEAVEHEGLENVRRIPGYHDEPLKGDARVEEVNHHDD